MKMTTTPHQYTNVQLLRTRVEAVQYSYDYIPCLVRNDKKSVTYFYTNIFNEPIAIKQTSKKILIAYKTISAQISELSGEVIELSVLCMTKHKSYWKNPGVGRILW